MRKERSRSHPIRPRLRASFVLVALPAFLIGGCCSSNPSSNTTTCSITYANSTGPSPTCSMTEGTVSGYIVFTGNVSLQRGANVMIQWSTDNFATTVYTGAGVVNLQGVVAVPFGFTASYCSSMTFQVRAFQDPNFTGTWAAGQAAGRYDGTDSGNSTFTNAALDLTTTSVSGLLIYLDGTAAQ